LAPGDSLQGVRRVIPLHAGVAKVGLLYTHKIEFSWPHQKCPLPNTKDIWEGRLEWWTRIFVRPEREPKARVRALTALEKILDPHSPASEKKKGILFFEQEGTDLSVRDLCTVMTRPNLWDNPNVLKECLKAIRKLVIVKDVGLDHATLLSSLVLEEEMPIELRREVLYFLHEFSKILARAESPEVRVANGTFIFPRFRVEEVKRDLQLFYEWETEDRIKELVKKTLQNIETYLEKLASLPTNSCR